MEDNASIDRRNTLVLKPASDTPILSIELVKILEKAGFPKVF